MIAKLLNALGKEKAILVVSVLFGMSVSGALLFSFASLEPYTGRNFFSNLFSSVNSGLKYHGIQGLVLMSLLMYYFNFWCRKVSLKSKSAFILSLIFGLFLTIGKAYEVNYGEYRSVLAPFDSGVWFLIFLFFLVCITILFYLVICHLFYLIDAHSNSCEKRDISESWYWTCFDGHTFSISLLILTLCHIPYLVFYPGTIPYDGMNQLNQYFGYSDLTQHHPVFVTMFMGLIVDIGSKIHSVNFGVFIYAIIQTVILILVSCYSINEMKKMNAPRSVLVVAILFYAIVPIWGVYAQNLIKDSLYMSVFLVYMILVVKVIRSSEGKFNLSMRDLTVSFFVCLFLVLMRNEGILIVIFTCAALLFLKIGRTNKLKLLICGVLVLSFSLCFNLLVGKLGISSGSKAEMLSVPFQQTARYVNIYPNDITEAEFNSIFRVLDMEAIECYDPYLSDPVKDGYKSPSKEEILEYFKVWFQMGTRHPEVYIDSFVSNTYAYYCPNVTNVAMNDNLQLYSAFGIMNIDYSYAFPDGVRDAMTSLIRGFEKIPGIGLLMNPAFYVWVILFCIAYILRSKQSEMLVSIIPMMIVIMVCLMSPVNGYLRYMLPVIISTPFILWWLLGYKQCSND